MSDNLSILLETLILLFAFAFLVLWLWMLVDCLEYGNGYKEKLGWLLFILLVPPLGALLYFVTSRRRLAQRIS